MALQINAYLKLAASVYEVLWRYNVREGRVRHHRDTGVWRRGVRDFRLRYTVEGAKQVIKRRREEDLKLFLRRHS